MKQQYIIFLLLFTLSLGIQAQSWTQKKDLTGSARYSAMAFSNGDYGYICNGSDNNTYYRDLWQYDPQADSWTKKDSFPGTDRRGGISFTIDSISYVGLGWDNRINSVYDDLFSYNPSTDKWDTISAKYTGGGGRGSRAVAYDGKAYIAGGGKGPGSAVTNELWEYDPVADQWTQKANMNAIRTGGVMFTIDTLIYYALGHDHINGYQDLWAYNVSTDSWASKKSLPGSGRLNASVFVVNGKAVIGGGYLLGGIELSDYYAYDPQTDSWDTLTSFTKGKRAISGAFAIRDKGYIVSGWDSTNTAINDLWEYTDTTIVTSIYHAENQKLDHFNLFPNPTSDKATFEFSVAGSKTLLLYDAAGKLLRQETISPYDKRYEIDLSSLNTGSYMYRVIEEQRVYSGIIMLNK